MTTVVWQRTQTAPDHRPVDTPETDAAANYFAFLSGMVNAFEVDPPPGGDKLPI